jgi:endonuclease/exonuclease/phosphatase family metal-dependent hydrolase
MENRNVQDDTLRVMTFNLLTSTKKRRTHPWRLRKRMVARIFRQFRPHVVGTQEANLPQLRELAEILPDYDFLGEGNLSGTALQGSVRNWYCATFYRRDAIRPAEEGDTYWLSPTPDVPASQFGFATRPRVASWQTFEHIPSGRTFVFGNTHLEAVGGWHRRKSALLLREYVDLKLDELGKDTPLFLTGDFNALADSTEIQALQMTRGYRYPLYDAWAATGGSGRDGATFRGLGLRDRLGNLLLGPRRIDYVFYRPELEVRDVRRVDFDPMVRRECARPSDHFPVLAEFKLDA